MVTLHQSDDQIYTSLVKNKLFIHFIASLWTTVNIVAMFGKLIFIESFLCAREAKLD